MTAAQRDLTTASGDDRAMKALLQPDSVAILGCSAEAERINGRPLKYFLEKGYNGRLFPVNPKYAEIAGLRCYPDVSAIPDPVDLAVVAVPAALVLDSVRQLIAKGVKAAVIFSSGFAETGERGVAAQAELIATARAGGLRICGPNAVEIINAFEGVTASFSEYLEGALPTGPIGFVSQSGAFGTAIAVLARQRQLGLGYFINTGNEADVEVADAIGFIVEDPRIRIVAGYLEGIRSGRKLLSVADRAMALGKPIILTKVGRSDTGARAAASHTGSLAGADVVFDGVVRQKGIIRADDEQQMMDLVEAFAHCLLPKGPNVGIVSQSGGAGVLACDRAETLGLQVPTLSDATQKNLHKVLPGYSAVANPVDVTGLSLAEPELMRSAMKLVLADPAVDIGLLWLRLMHRYADVMIDIITDIRDSTDKTFVVSWLAPPPEALAELRKRGICVIDGAAQSMNAVGGLFRYASARKRWLADSAARDQMRTGSSSDLTTLPHRAGVVATMAAADILRDAQIPLVATEFAGHADAAAVSAQRLGYPVALKVESPDVAHKTEAGAVRLKIADKSQLRDAYADIIRLTREYNASARIDGVIVQRMAGSGIEIVIGVHQDPSFGPVVMVGLGGILVEVLKDVAFAAAPMNSVRGRDDGAELARRANTRRGARPGAGRSHKTVHPSGEHIAHGRGRRTPAR